MNWAGATLVNPNQSTGKTWFITGVSRGLGKALAEAALKRGDAVIGTVREGGPEIVSLGRKFFCLTG